MRVNPVYLLSIIYLLGSFIGFTLGVQNLGFNLLDKFYPVSQENFYYSFFLDVSVVFFICALYKLFRFQGAAFSRDFVLGSGWGWFIIIHQFLFICFVFFTGAGIAGSGFSFDGFNLYNYYFIALSPDLLSFVILPLLRSRVQFFFGFLILLLSFLMRGWMSGVLFALILLITYVYPFKFRFQNFMYCFFIFVLVLVSLPALDALKWGVRLGFTVQEIFYYALSNFNVEGYALVLERLVYRFSHINNTAMIMENVELFKLAYAEGLFKPYWQNGIFYETLCRIFENCNIHLNEFIVQKVYDPGGKDWDVDPGIGGWLAILGYRSLHFISFFVIFFFSVYWLVFRFLPHKAKITFFSFALIYFFHGWISPFFNLTFYFLVFALFTRLNISRRYFQ
jgi:hypothetical protein